MGFLFKAHLREKVLKGIKTQTRRLWKPGQELATIEGVTVLLINGRVKHRVGADYSLPAGRGKLGEWQTRHGDAIPDPLDYARLHLRDDHAKGPAVRRFLEQHGCMERRMLILDIWKESLNDISDEDAQAEGCELSTGVLPGGGVGLASPRLVFSKLWDSINKGAGDRWVDNPFVGAYKFEVIEKSWTR